MELATLIYRSDFSVLCSAAVTYLTAIVGITQTLVVEVAETTMQAGYDRATWFYGAWATAHYSALPVLPVVEDVEPDYWFEPLEMLTDSVNILTPLHLYLSPPQSPVIGLLPPGKSGTVTDLGVRELRAIAKQRGVKGYSKLSKARLLEILS